jgi:hypothetical protein
MPRFDYPRDKYKPPNANGCKVVMNKKKKTAMLK